MKERPILFSAPMVRAILEGRKTQTRRIYKNRKHPDFGCDMAGCELAREQQHVIDRICPYGQPGDRLWVREAIRPLIGYAKDHQGRFPIIYRADQNGFDDDRVAGKQIPSIHMPRWASRILLEIVAVRVERLGDISEKDAIAEGIDGCLGDYLTPGQKPGEGFAYADGRGAFSHLWESINGDGSWAANPWVWVVEFKMVTP